MRKLCRIASILFLAPWAAAQAADTDVRVIISSDVRPGVYGRVEIGSAPPPPVVYSPCSRCTFTSRRDTRSIGRSIARATTPAAFRCIS